MSLVTAAIVILSLWVIAIVVAGLVMALRPGGVGVKFAPTVTAPADSAGIRQEIPLGGEAEVFGNVRGRVAAVLLRPQTRQIAAVQLGGGILDTETVPVEAILAADGNTLSLSNGWQDRNLEPDGSWAILRDNMPVAAGNGKRLGRLRVVSFDPASGTATAIVFEGRGDWDRRLVPMDQVVEAGPDRVLTSLRAADAGKLQVFATDWELRQAILERLAGDPELQGLQRALRIDVRDQKVRIQGYVPDRGKAEQVQSAIRQVPGVLQLESDLTTDDQLAQAVKDALARDPATASVQINVTVRSGVVDIIGEVPDRATLRRLDALTQQIDGAQVVHNMVVVRAQTPATR